MSSVSRNQKTEKDWRPRPGAGQGWRRPSEWMTRKRIENIPPLPSLPDSPPHQKQTFTLTLTFEASPLAAWVLRRALRRRGFRQQLRIALGMAIEERLREWGFPVDGVYKVVAGVLSDGKGGAQ